MASRMFSIASCSVAPCDQHPGNPGHETLKPSSDCCNKILYFIPPPLACASLPILEPPDARVKLRSKTTLARRSRASEDQPITSMTRSAVSTMKSHAIRLAPRALHYANGSSRRWRRLRDLLQPTPHL